jgi:hypothetical protein
LPYSNNSGSSSTFFTESVTLPSGSIYLWCLSRTIPFSQRGYMESPYALPSQAKGNKKCLYTKPLLCLSSLYI